MYSKLLVLVVFLLSVSASVCTAEVAPGQPKTPAEVLDLRYWKLTLPTDDNTDGKVDEVDVSQLANYSHPDFFYVDEHGFVVFAAPNKAATTANSTNTRSELRQMYRGKNTRISTHGQKNNFAIKANRQARRFADVGGQLEATLRILHVAKRAKYPKKTSAFSVVVGQIHALKNESLQRRGYGYGNEPLKIFYKKWPEHETGSVFWTYERNLSVDDPNRNDIAYPVWGNSWDNSEDPGESGIELGQLFNYNVNVHGNVMHLTFRTADPSQTRTFTIDLSKNVDEKDNPNGYSGDSFYFKAGAYNQCSTRDSDSFRYPACPGSGNWEQDQANGDYTAVAFRQIIVARATDPQD